jgi:hypothetical protein
MRHSRSGIIRRIPRTIRGLIRLRYRLREARSARISPPPDPAGSPLDVAI